MKIKIIVSLSTQIRNYAPGVVTEDFSDIEAQKLIDAGFAVVYAEESSGGGNSGGFSGKYSDLEGAPTDLRDFTNYDGFVKKDVTDLHSYHTKWGLEEFLVGKKFSKMIVVETLPTGIIDYNAIYLVKVGETSYYEPHVYMSEAEPWGWVKLGAPPVDLSDYYTKEQIDGKITSLMNVIQDTRASVNMLASEVFKAEPVG